MLLVDEARRRCTFVPLMFLGIGLLFGVATVGAAMAPDGTLGTTLAMSAVTLLPLGWFSLGVRLARRDGDAIVVRTLTGTQRVPAEGSEIALQRGGGFNAPHIDVLLQPVDAKALRLARFETLGFGRTPGAARRIAAALDVRVDERSVGELEAQLRHAAEQRRGSWRLLAAVAAVGAVASVIMLLVTADTMATLEVRCPGGKVTQGSATLLDGLRMTTDPGTQTFQVHPADGPPWTQRVELVAGQTTVLDCSARPSTKKVEGSQTRGAPSTAQGRVSQ